MTSPGINEHGVTLSMEYEDSLMARISPDEVIRRDGRVRRRNRIVRAGGTLVVAVIAATVAVLLLRGTTPPSDRLTVSPYRLLAATSAYQQHLPAGTPVVVDRSTGWRSFAWLSADDQFCSGTIGVSPQDRSAVAITCVKPVSFGSPNKSGAPNKDFAAATEPVFQVLPPPGASGDKVLVIGLARNDVASIEIRFLGSNVPAAVYPIRVAGVVKGVAYAAWLPLKQENSYGTDDITAFIARNKSGGILRS